MKIRKIKKQLKRNGYSILLLLSIKQWHKALRHNPDMPNFIKWCIKFENNLLKNMGLLV